MWLQLGETAGPLPLPVAKNTSHGDLGVVIKDGLRNAAKEAERPNMAVAEGFRRLGGVTRRRRELHHLGDRARVNSKPSRRRAMAQPLDLNRVANAPIKLHALHPPPSAGPTQRDICCRTFAPALPENPAASVRDYCSAAYNVVRHGFETPGCACSGGQG